MEREDAVHEAMARALFVSAWADCEERGGRTYPGMELYEVAPETPPEAYRAAAQLIIDFERANRKDLDAMYRRALETAGLQDGAAVRKDFGYLTAMQALGHGVAWFNHYPDHGLEIPSIEFLVDDC
jgi:hypothetical protein